MTRVEARQGARSSVLHPAAMKALGVLDALAVRIAVVDVAGRLVMANRAWWAQQATVGAGIRLGDRYALAADVRGDIDADDLVAAQALLDDVLAGRRIRAGVDYRVGETGVPRWCHLEILPIRENGTPVGALVTYGDITVRIRAEADLQHNSSCDEVTGLPQRQRAHQAIQEHLGEAPGHGRVALVVMDLDRFRLVNDSLGRAVGDLLLREVSERLQTALREGQLLAHLSGDEFAVVCPGPIDAGGAVAVAERLRAALGAPLPTPRGDVAITASIGVAVDCGAVGSPADLLGEAEAAMHRAKEVGPGCVRVADPRLRTRARRHLEATTALHHALQRGQFRLHYQPVVELGTGRVLGAEALLRWAHPSRGLVRATDFIHIVEGSGLIVPVGRWVTRQVCEDLRSWQDAYPESPISVAFNLSPRQLLDASLISTLEDAIADSGCDPRALVIEITEGRLSHDDGASDEVFARIADLGLSLSIDDFGTGYSSLKRLQQLTVHGLKIDRSFVAGVSKGGRDRAIVDATVGLARALGIRVVAEGVETVEQARHLADTGAVEAQGWLWSTALSGEEFTALLRSGASLPRQASCGRGPQLAG